MDRERWRRIEEVFHQATALPKKEWAQFLARLPDDEALRAEVASLLQSSAAEDDPVVEVVEQSLRQIVDDGSGQQTFGPYRADHKLAGGNQADVYLATRTDGEYRTEVAVKVAKRGFPTEDLRQRFRQERQILASLNHPNIARLLDGGTTEDGFPFLVMEYVDGQPIDSYCDHQRLPIRRRLELFQAVCSAVEHAHRNLTIHRDLKPSNILVTTDGQPVLLDFGIAKLLAEPTATDAPIKTVEGLRFLTPAYASPEQVLGQPLTTSTDIYSLGVVLYTLLAGRPPYTLEGLEPKALFETVCEKRPVPPSFTLSASNRRNNGEGDRIIASARRETVAGLRQHLRGDLDTIVQMAMRKEPERRYASVAALAEDLDRFLTHRPIRARKETPSYRMTMLVRRHPYGVAATCALLLAILVGVASTLHATWQAREQRDRAQISQAEAEGVTDFMVGLFEVASPEVSLGEKVSAVEMLDRGAELIGDQLDAQPLSRARLLGAMGQAYHGLGLYERAVDLFQESISDRQQALGPLHPEVAKSHLDLARSTLPRGDYSTAEKTIERALEICIRVGPTADPIRASATNLLAQVRQQQGDIEQAEALYREALALHTRLLGADHLITLESLNDLGEALSERRQFKQAGEVYRDVLTGQRRQLSALHPDVLKTSNNLATAQLGSGDLEGAEATMREVVEARRQLYGEDHPHVALAYSNLGQVLSSQGKNEEALLWLERALDLSVEHYGEAHPRVADLLYNAGFVLQDLGRLDDAERRMAASRTIRQATLGDQHPAVAQSLVALAGIHRHQGRTQEAIEEARMSHLILRDALPANDYRQSSPLLQLGLLLTDAGRCDEARAFLDQAVALRREVLPADHPALADAIAARQACS